MHMNTFEKLAVVAEETTNMERTTAAEETHETGVLGSLGINGQMLAFQFVNFLLVLGILWYLILRPLMKTMDERRRVIDEGLHKSRQADTDLKMSTVKAQELIDAAKVEGNKLMEQATREADELATRMEERARKEIELLIVQAKKNIEIDEADMRERLRRETAAIAIEISKKIIGKTLDSETDKRLIEEALRDIPKA
jgi:F-type H+-transporting ATPase subunit b